MTFSLFIFPGGDIDAVNFRFSHRLIGGKIGFVFLGVVILFQRRVAFHDLRPKVRRDLASLVALHAPLAESAGRKRGKRRRRRRKRRRRRRREKGK